MRKIIARVVAPLLLAVSALPSAAAVVYEQGWGGVAEVYTSQQNGPDIPSFKVYDNFSLSASTSIITDVHWTGGFFESAVEYVGPSNFLIEFWDSVAGTEPGSTKPGKLYKIATFSGPVRAEPIGVANSVSLFKYEVDLATAIEVAAETEYWLSIQQLFAFPPQWGWATTVGPNGPVGPHGDGVSYFDSVDSDGADGTTRQFDMAFSLTNTPINNAPEPGSLLLAGLALAALFGTSRVKKTA